MEGSISEQLSHANSALGNISPMFRNQCGSDNYPSHSYLMASELWLVQPGQLLPSVRYTMAPIQ